MNLMNIIEALEINSREENFFEMRVISSPLVIFVGLVCLCHLHAARASPIEPTTCRAPRTCSRRTSSISSCHELNWLPSAHNWKRPHRQQQQLAYLSAASPPSQPLKVLRISLMFALCTFISLLSDSLTSHILKAYAREGLAISVTFFHFAMSALCGLIIVPVLQWSRTQHARPEETISSADWLQRWLGVPSIGMVAAAIGPLALCQVGGFLSTNLSLQFVPVSFSHTVKACECLFTAALAYLVLGQRLNRVAYAALVPTATGVALSAASEMHFSLVGFLAAMASNMCFAMRSVLSTRFLRGGKPVPASTLYWLLCCAACAALTPSFVAVGGTAMISAPGSGRLLALLCVCGMAHFGYNLLSFEILQLTSPVSHVVLHALRRILVIGASSVLTRQPVSALNWSGIAIASMGVLGYAAAQ